MKITQEFDRMFRLEFPDSINNLIYRDDTGNYCVFDRYKIIPQKPGYLVMCSATQVGIFGSTKSAMA